MLFGGSLPPVLLIPDILIPPDIKRIIGLPEYLLYAKKGFVRDGLLILQAFHRKNVHDSHRGRGIVRWL